MSKKITKISPMWHGHLKIDFEDGTSAYINRGDHGHGVHGVADKPMPKVGELWPPQKEESNAKVSAVPKSTERNPTGEKPEYENKALRTNGKDAEPAEVPTRRYGAPVRNAK